MTGTFTETVEVDTPWPMTLPVASFTPRFFRAVAQRPAQELP